MTLFQYTPLYMYVTVPLLYENSFQSKRATGAFTDQVCVPHNIPLCTAIPILTYSKPPQKPHPPMS